MAGGRRAEARAAGAPPRRTGPTAPACSPASSAAWPTGPRRPPPASPGGAAPRGWARGHGHRRGRRRPRRGRLHRGLRPAGRAGSGGCDAARGRGPRVPRPRPPAQPSGHLSGQGAIDPHSNRYWAQSTVTVRTAVPLAAFTVELRVAQTGGVADTGNWRSLPEEHFTVAVREEAGALVYTWTLRPGRTVPAGQHVFARPVQPRRGRPRRGPGPLHRPGHGDGRHRGRRLRRLLSRRPARHRPRRTGAPPSRAPGRRRGRPPEPAGARPAPVARAPWTRRTGVPGPGRPGRASASDRLRPAAHAPEWRREPHAGQTGVRGTATVQLRPHPRSALAAAEPGRTSTRWSSTSTAPDRGSSPCVLLTPQRPRMRASADRRRQWRVPDDKRGGMKEEPDSTSRLGGVTLTPSSTAVPKASSPRKTSSSPPGAT